MCKYCTFPLIKRGILIQTISYHFSIDLCPEEGGGTVELIPSGRDLAVTETNVFDYVRKYAEYRMIKTQEKSLEVKKKLINYSLT